MYLASIFDVIIVKPIFNLLVFIYGIIPGHNFGVSIILFTILVRLLMWPVVKKQLHQAKAMRELQPDIKRIKKAAAGNRQQESVMLMELYKEKEISPFGSLGTMVIQVIILLGLYSGLTRVVANPQAIIDHSYSWMHNLPGLKELAGNPGSFDGTLLGFVDLKRAATGPQGLYMPALVIVVASALAQYFQAKQLMPDAKDSRGLRTILKDANTGKTADQSEVSAAVGASTRYILPVFILFVTIGLASALSLYWLVGGLVAYIQQARILGQGEAEFEAIADNTILEGEVIPPKTPKTKKKPNKRRK